MAVGNLMAQPLRIDKDGMALLHGKRTFILGIYENPKEDKVVREISEAGFNMVRVTMQDSSSTIKALDRLAAYKLGAWVRGDFDLSHDAAARKQKLKAMIRSFGHHPALWVWDMPDEALWNLWMEAWTYRTDKEIKQLMEVIGDVKDTTERIRLENKVKAITSYYDDAAFVKGQQAADGLWKELGKEPPGLCYDMAATPRKEREMAEGLKKGYAFVKALDPNRPILMNHAPRNQIHQLAFFSKAADIVGCDIYPAPESSPYSKHSDLADQSLTCVGAYTERMRKAAPGKPVWMALQGFGWGDYRTELPEAVRKEIARPTLEETRFMAYDAIVHGARGISYWGTYVIEKDSQLWKDILSVVREIADLQFVLSATDATRKLSLDIAETAGSMDRTIQVLPKQVDGKLYIIVVNESKDPLQYKINGLNNLNGVTYVDVLSDKKAKVVNGSLPLFIGGRRVQVLKPLSQ
jgi:hypothetical protein